MVAFTPGGYEQCIAFGFRTTPRLAYFEFINPMSVIRRMVIRMFGIAFLSSLASSGTMNAATVDQDMGLCQPLDAPGRRGFPHT